MAEYAGRLPLFHLDLYRLADASEALGRRAHRRAPGGRGHPHRVGRTARSGAARPTGSRCGSTGPATSRATIGLTRRRARAGAATSSARHDAAAPVRSSPSTRPRRSRSSASARPTGGSPPRRRGAPATATARSSSARIDARARRSRGSASATSARSSSGRARRVHRAAGRAGHGQGPGARARDPARRDLDRASRSLDAAAPGRSVDAALVAGLLAGRPVRPDPDRSRGSRVAGRGGRPSRSSNRAGACSPLDLADRAPADALARGTAVRAELAAVAPRGSGSRGSARRQLMSWRRSCPSTSRCRAACARRPERWHGRATRAERRSSRPWTLADVASVEAIELASFSAPWPPNAYRTELQTNRLAHYMVIRVGSRDRRLRGSLADGRRGARHDVRHPSRLAPAPARRAAAARAARRRARSAGGRGDPRGAAVEPGRRAGCTRSSGSGRSASARATTPTTTRTP